MVEAAARQLAAGTMLDDKYRIERLLAVGGMGAVYVGTHTKLRKKVAIKVLNPALTSDAMVQRFQREAITASQIGHEGIAQVTDLGTSAAGEPFLVMEFLEGESLANRLKAAGALPVELACELTCSILSPLAAAHAAGIVHRDLKPDNVFLVKQSRGELVKLLDFGISRAQGLDGDMRLTNTGVVMGTPYYMSPEQARGDSEVTPSADIYSIGVILYEMLLGNLPITGENYNQLIWRVMNAEYEAPRIRRPEIPLELEQIILRAMALESSVRPNAQELEHALLAFCRPTYREHMIERISGAGIPWGTPAPGTSPPHRSSQPAPMLQGTDPTLLAPSGMQPKRSKLPWILAGILLVGGAGIAAFVALGGSKETTATAKADPPVAPVEAPAAPVAKQPPPVAKAEPPPQAPPAVTPETITLRFNVEPATAIIQIDGKAVTAEHTVPKDGAEHALTITAPGFDDYAETIKFDETQRIKVALEKQKANRPTRPTRPKGPKGNNRNDRIDSESPYSQ